MANPGGLEQRDREYVRQIHFTVSRRSALKDTEFWEQPHYHLIARYRVLGATPLPPHRQVWIEALKPAFFDVCAAQEVDQFQHQQAVIYRRLTPGKWDYLSDPIEQEVHPSIRVTLRHRRVPQSLSEPHS